MSTSAADLLQLAALLEGGADEASWRGAVGRAYYASYYGCLAWHTAQTPPGSVGGHPGGVHQTLINQLKNGAPEWPQDRRTLGKSLAYRLGALLTRRRIADYEPDAEFAQDVACTDCANARFLAGLI